eukprot:scaffold48_cov395-Prasinococcus_capsulatus_cf.AAC.49
MRSVRRRARPSSGGRRLAHRQLPHPWLPTGIGVVSSCESLAAPSSGRGRGPRDGSLRPQLIDNVAGSSAAATQPGGAAQTLLP